MPISAAKRARSGADRAPDALRRRRQLDMLDAEFGQRVDDRIGDGGQSRRDAAFAAAAHAERVGRRRHLADLGLEERQQSARGIA